MKINTYVLSTAELDHKLIEKSLTNGIEIDAVSFIQVEPVREDNLNEELKRLCGLKLTAVFTSANALQAMSGILDAEHPGWDVYCIGIGTQKAVLEHFAPAAIKGTAIDGEGLARVIHDHGIKDVVFFCGDKRLDALPQFLYQHEVMVREVVVYKTKETPEQVVKHYQGIMFYSPNGVNSFFRVNKVWPHTVLFAIGNTTAAAIKSKCSNEVVAGDIPSKDHLVDKVIAYFHKTAH